MDQLNDLFRQSVTRRGLSREDISSRHGRLTAVIDQIQVLVNNVHQVEQLPLVGVDLLDLNVEERIGVDFQPGGIIG